jgi:hypothetical protein
MKEIDLRQFCGTQPERPYLHDPFSFGAFTYATNGHIIVRVDRLADAREGDMPSKTAVERILSVHNGAAFLPVSDVSIPPLPTTVLDCWFCGGRGTMHDCPDCKCVCPHCNGTGRVNEKRSINIGSVSFDVKYITQILALPSPEVCASPKERDPMPFRFAGGIGCLMPISGSFENSLGDIEKYRIKTAQRRAETAP